MANPQDGTQLGTSEVIADEYIDPNLGARPSPLVPPTGYKMPRSKIAVGPYGTDAGDATYDYPLPVESRADRQLQELAALRTRDMGMELLMKSATETMVIMDSRGHHIANRGTR